MPESLPFAVNTIRTWAYWTNQGRLRTMVSLNSMLLKLWGKTKKQNTHTHSSEDFVLLPFVK